MVRKASRKRGPRSDGATPSTISGSAAPAPNGAAMAFRRGIRAGELKNTTRNASLLYQVYDSAPIGGSTTSNAPSPSRAAVVAAAAVLANPFGQTHQPPSSSLVSGGGTSNNNNNISNQNVIKHSGSGRRGSLTSVAGAGAAAGSETMMSRARKASNGPSPTIRARQAGRKGVQVDASAPVSSDDTVLPRPYAKGGSYANENPRLIVSEPLPSTTTCTSSCVITKITSPASATFRSRAYATNNNDNHNTANHYGPIESESPQGPKRKTSGRSPPRNVIQVSTESFSSSRSGASGRPRAVSLPRTRESVGEMLPRLRPVRGNNTNSIHNNSDPALGSGGSGDSSPGRTLDGLGETLRPSPPLSCAGSNNSSSSNNTNGRHAQGEAVNGELREALSAPPATFSDLTASTSPRQPVRRTNRGGADVHTREIPAELEALSEGGGDQGGRHQPSHNGAFMRPVKVKAASAAPAPTAGGGPPQPLPLSPPVTVGKAATKKWNVQDLSNQIDDDDDENWGDPELSSDDAAGHTFDSTQLLSSLRPRLNGGGGDSSPSSIAVAAAAGDRTFMVQPPRQPVVPSVNRPHPFSPPAPDASASSPPYRFNVVLSSGKTATVPISLTAGSGCVQGMRPTMEDAHFIELNATHVRGQPVSLMAVLDGHCGRRVADLGAKWLPHYVLHHAALGENNALALVESILQTDREIFHILQAKKAELELQRKTGRTTGRRRRDVCDEMAEESTGANGGSTLIVAAVCGRMLYVACLGDARAVLYDGQTTIAMSEDHKPSNADESRRIAKCGGFVQFGRVCGILAVSRALGDFEFKFQPSSNSEEEGLLTDFPFGAQREGGVGSGCGGSAGEGTANTSSSPTAAAATGGNTPQPGSQANRRFISNRDLMVSNVADVRQLNLTDASAFLILACDGLWDVLSNEEATEFVRDFLSYTPDVCDPRIVSGEKPRPSPEVVRRVLNNCCQKLTEFAVDRGSMDNVSAMVLFFHDVVDTVARFNGQQSASRESRCGGGGGNNSSTSGGVVSGASSHSSRTRQNRGSVQPSSSSSSAFELTSNQLKVRNGRVVTRR